MCFGYIGKRNTHFQLLMEYGFKTKIPDCPEVDELELHRYLCFIRVGLICRKQRRFCNCLHVFSKMFLHQVCWKHHHNFLWIPFSIFSLFWLFLAFFIGRQYCASQFQGDNPEILSKTKFCFWFGEHQLMWSNCWRTIFDSITHYYRRIADDNTTPNSALHVKNNCE